MKFTYPQNLSLTINFIPYVLYTERTKLTHNGQLVSVRKFYFSSYFFYLVLKVVHLEKNPVGPFNFGMNRKL